MTMRAFLVVLGLLASVATASAECAWVLWRYELSVLGVPSSATWAADDTAANSATEPDLRQILLPAGVVYYNKRNKVFSARYYICLPDTIDPRARR